MSNASYFDDKEDEQWFEQKLREIAAWREITLGWFEKWTVNSHYD